MDIPDFIIIFLAGFIQMLVVSLNISNISQKKICSAMASSFFLALGWYLILEYIVQNVNSAIDRYAYAIGASTGTGLGIYLDKIRLFPRAKNRFLTFLYTRGWGI